MNSAYEELKRQFKNGIKENEPLAPYTTYKVGGPADLFFAAGTGEELIDVILSARNLNIPVFVLGGGSNILVGDGGFRGLVIKNNSSVIAIRGMRGNIKGIKKESVVYLETDSGVPMNRLVRFTAEEGLSGLEMHLGLPGTVGGAVFMNSKWMKPSAFVGDSVYRATVLTPSNKLKNVGQEYFHFAYGKSTLQGGKDILIRVVFALKREDTDVLWKRANESIAYRRETQPQGVQTAGCVFKNITSADAFVSGTPDHTTGAGFLLDKAGCKGMKTGKAEVSSRHANFIITRAGATASDVVELIELMKETVKKKFGVTLREEILRIGAFSKKS